MIDSKSLELQFRTKLTGEQETLQQFSTFSGQLADSFARAFDSALAQVQARMTQLVDPAGRPISSGGGAVPPQGSSPAFTTAPPPLNQGVGQAAGFQMGASQFPGSVWGQAMAGPGPFSNMGQQFYQNANAPLYGPNLDMDLAIGESRAFAQVHRAGGQVRMTPGGREQLTEQRELARETLETALVNLKGLTDAIKDATKGQENLKNEIADLKKLAAGGDQTAADQLLGKQSKQNEINQLFAQREATLQAIDKGARGVGSMTDALALDSGTMTALITKVVGVTAGLGMFASQFPTAYGRSQAYGTDVRNLSSRAMMQGDYSSVLAYEHLGGEEAVKNQSLITTLIRAIATTGAAAYGGAQLGAAFGPYGAAGGAIAGVGTGLYEALNFNQNVRGNIEEQRSNELLQNKEWHQAFNTGMGFSQRTFGMARGMGDTNFSDFLASGVNSGMARQAGLTPDETLEANRQLLISGGRGATSGSMGRIYQMQGLGLSNAGTVAGQLYMGGADNATGMGAGSLLGLAGQAYGIMDPSRIAQFMGNVGAEAGVGLGGSFGATQRAESVMATTQGFGDLGGRSGQMALALQQQTANVAASGPGSVSGMLGTMAILPQVARAFGLKVSDLDASDIDFLNRQAATMTPKGLADHFNQKYHKSGMGMAGGHYTAAEEAAAGAVVRSPFTGGQLYGQAMGPVLGRMFKGRHIHAATAEEENAGITNYDVQAAGGHPVGTGVDLMGKKVTGLGAAQNQLIATGAAQIVSAGLETLAAAMPALKQALKHLITNMEKVNNQTFESTFMPRH